MQIVSNIALITINETLIVQLITFLLFLFIINRVMFRPLRRVIFERSAYIEMLQQEISDQQNELKSISVLMQEREQNLLQEAHRMRITHEDTGKLEANKIIAATRQELSVLKDKTEKDINNRILEVGNELKDESDALALQIMEKILDRRLSS